MDNNVVHRCARGLQEAGLVVLRFNFRSVGASEGEHDGEGAEDGDLSAALDELQRRYPDLPLWAGGFSFGSRTTVRVALGEARIERVLLVALPVLAYDCTYADDLAQPGLAIMAELDDFGTLAVLQERLPKLAAHLELQEIAGEGHFFKGALDDLRARVYDWARRSLG
ncbi:MAG: alpha/beta superfamily hydrolase [Planctomycetota bacterium]|jgi:alpha/beta superfamily hydrolase